MKKNLLIGVLALGLLASCGGGTEPAATSGAAESAATSAKTSSSKASSSKHTHTYDETKWESDETQHWHPATCEHTTQKGSAAAHTLVDVEAECVAATCQADGKKVQQCSVCGYKVTTTIAKGAHTWGEASAEAGRAEGKVGYKTRACSVCAKKDLFIDANDANKTLNGTMKSATDGTVKLSSNGDYITYVLDIPENMSNVTVAINGWVDYFNDGSNNNNERGFFSRKSGEGANLEVKLNDEVVEITNTKTYAEMGMQARDDGTTNSTFALCELGTVSSVAAGELTITYTRLESYNLNIDSIHFIY